MQQNKVLEVEVFDSEEAVAQAVAEEVLALIRSNPQAKISFPTGSTLQKTYEILREKARSGEFSLSEAKVFLLDEYVGLPINSKDSYLSFIINEIQKPCGLPIESLHAPDVHAEDLDKASEDYESRIAYENGLDLQILGIGSNGHIGFNEPGTPFDSKTRVTDLAEETRLANSKYFGNDLGSVPKSAITQGLSTILSAKRIILVANAPSKAAAVRRLLEGDQSEELPASALLSHQDTRVILNESAFSENQA